LRASLKIIGRIFVKTIWLQWLSFAGKLEHLVVGSNPLVRDPLLSGDDRTRGVLHHLQRVQASQVQVLPD